MRIRGWRKIGALIVRWPGPVLLGDDRVVAGRSAHARPATAPTTTTATTCPPICPPTRATPRPNGTSVARMNPEMLLIESDHDLRNSADFLVIDKIAKAVFRVPGIGSVQAITRPTASR